jgi:hypothetical protein
MTAYSAVFLLKLLRSPSILTQLHEGNAHEIHSMISKTADAYQDASTLSPASSAAAYHARFLRNLVANDIFIAQQDEKDALELTPIESRLQGQYHLGTPLYFSITGLVFLRSAAAVGLGFSSSATLGAKLSSKCCTGSVPRFIPTPHRLLSRSSRAAQSK